MSKRPDERITPPHPIDARLARWHADYEVCEPLHDYLDLTWDEYVAWADGTLSDDEAWAIGLAKRRIRGR